MYVCVCVVNTCGIHRHASLNGSYTGLTCDIFKMLSILHSRRRQHQQAVKDLVFKISDRYEHLGAFKFVKRTPLIRKWLTQRLFRIVSLLNIFEWNAMPFCNAARVIRSVGYSSDIVCTLSISHLSHLSLLFVQLTSHLNYVPPKKKQTSL